MPSLAEQHQRMRTFTAPFSVFRLQTPLKMTHEAAKDTCRTVQQDCR
jgi:hypothetical protein